jgi:hypothetical protein
VGLQDPHTRAERDNRRDERVPRRQHHAGRRDGSERDGVPLHRPGHVDDEGDRAPGRGPAARDDVRGTRPTGRTRLPCVEGAVQVEVAVAAGHRGEPPGTAGLGRADPAEAQEHPARELPGGGAQPFVGGDGEVGEQRGRGLGVAGEQRVERGRVERAHLR